MRTHSIYLVRIDVADTDLLIRVRGEWASLTGAERLLLASRLLLVLDPWDSGKDAPENNP